MAQILNRQQLYNLVWNTPVWELAKDFNISDRGLSKICARAYIPVPPRGYWAKKEAGKKVELSIMPARGLGKDYEISIGGHRVYNSWGYNRLPDELSNDEILNKPLPLMPVFNEDIRQLRGRVSKIIAKATMPKTLQNPHRFIAKLLSDDQKRLSKRIDAELSSHMDKPRFDSLYDQRRLKIINAIYITLEDSGFLPLHIPSEGRSFGVKIGDQEVQFILENVNTKDGQFHRELSSHDKSVSTDLKFLISNYGIPEEIENVWEDRGNDKLEKHISEIVAELIAAGEVLSRIGQIDRHERRIRRKQELLKSEQERVLAEAREAKDRQKRLEKARMDNLLMQANAFKQATEIRAYTDAVKKSLKTAPSLEIDQGVLIWLGWARAQADHIDPVISEIYKGMNKSGD